MNRTGAELVEFARQLPRNLHGFTVEELNEHTLDRAQKIIRNRALQKRRESRVLTPEQKEAHRIAGKIVYERRREAEITFRRDSLTVLVREAVDAAIAGRITDIVRAARGEPCLQDLTVADMLAATE